MAGLWPSTCLMVLHRLAITMLHFSWAGWERKQVGPRGMAQWLNACCSSRGPKTTQAALSPREIQCFWPLREAQTPLRHRSIISVFRRERKANTAIGTWVPGHPMCSSCLEFEAQAGPLPAQTLTLMMQVMWDPLILILWTFKMVNQFYIYK